MPILTTTVSPWPARCAYISAAIFTAASGGTNLIYGWQKGVDVAGSLVWAGVSLAVAIVFALSWPATIKSLEARRWSVALISLVALTLAGAYSVTAALGSASGGRVNAATAETATTDARSKAQTAYDAAKSELDALTVAKPATELQGLIRAVEAELTKLPAARSAAEIEALIRGAAMNPRGSHGCTAINGSLRMSCPKLEAEKARAEQRERLTTKIATWTAEIGQADQRRADQRSRLKADMDRASAELARIQPARVANSDAKALTRYLGALGLEVGPDRLNDLLVLLAVVMIEAGGGLSFALGMALSGPARTPVAPDTPDAVVAEPVALPAPDGEVVPAKVTKASRTVRPVVKIAGRTPESDIITWLLTAGGRTEGVRRLAEAIGRPRSTVSDECHRLVAAGQITMMRGRRRTVLSLVAAERRN